MGCPGATIEHLTPVLMFFENMNEVFYNVLVFDVLRDLGSQNLWLITIFKVQNKL